MTSRPAAILLLAISLPAARAADAPGHMHGGALIETERMPRVSLGANVEMLQRDIRVGNAVSGALEGTAASAYLGVDAFDWLTLFGTAGAVFLDSVGGASAASFDTGPRWSVGLNASLWHIDTTEPDFAKGRLSIGLIAEYMDATAPADAGDASWSETVAALPIGFEIPNEPMGYWGVHSLFLYAGPIYSAIDGKLDGPVKRDFSQTQDAGVLAGLDIYLARNVSLGGHLIIMDSVSAGASARYHF